ncbi:hypothetical protein M3J09_008286 [Ascochyta lentis]
MVYLIRLSATGVCNRVRSDLIICSQIGRAAESGRRSGWLSGERGGCRIVTNRGGRVTSDLA